MGKKRVMMIGLDSADPVHLQKLMDQGRVPNMKKLFEKGAAHEGMDMLGCLPSVTPPNWCSIATGNWPLTHGITCYTNHTLGKPLNISESNWDSGNVESEFIWEAFSKAGKRSIMLNYCEAWPPRIPDDQYGVFIDGSGVTPFLKCSIDYQKLVYMKEDIPEIKFTPHIIKSDNKDCVVMGDQYDEMKKQSISISTAEDFVWTTPTFDYPMSAEPPGIDMCHLGKAGNLADVLETPLKNPSNWSFELPHNARECTVFLAKNTVRRFAILTASDGVNYDTCTLYKNKRTEKPLAIVKGIGNWSDFVIDTYMKDEEEIKISYKIFMFDIAKDASSALLYFSHVTNMDNLDFFYPRDMGKELYEAVGPMLQFGKVFDDEHEYAELAHKLLLESYAQEQCAWHGDAAEWLFKKYPDWQLFYIHLHSIDNFQHWYINYTLPGTSDKPEYYQNIIDRCYEENDKFVGRMMAYLDEDTTIILTSDHGAIPHSPGDDYPGIGGIGTIATKVMSSLGYTVLKPGGTMGVDIDWEKTRAISARTSYIYINLKGREETGIVEPEDYDQLVQDIISDLYNYRDEKGHRIIAHCFTKDEMEYLGMGGPHCGDILFQLRPTYCCEHANCFSTVQNEGWSLHNLCFLSGSGIKEGKRFRRPVRITDIVPTICHLTDTPMPADVEGGIIYQALE